MTASRRHFLQAAAALSLTRMTGSAAEPSRRVRAGQIGTQHGHASGKMATLRKLQEDFTVIGLAGAGDNPGAAYDGIPRFTVEQLLQQPDLEAVVVETDFPDACAAAHAAIKAGKAVHLDKPGALDHGAFKVMRQEAEDRGLIFQMGYMLRYNAGFQFVFKAVKEGWLGRITEIDAMMGKKLDAAGRLDLMRLPGGGMFELGCHLVDAVGCILGKPQAVHSFAKPTDGDGFKDNQLAVLEYPTAVATLRCNMADPFGNPRRRFLITGTEGSLEIMPLESGRITARLTAPHGEYNVGEQQITLPAGGRYDAELQVLAAAIRENRPLPWNAAHDIAVHETALKAGGSSVQ